MAIYFLRFFSPKTNLRTDSYGGSLENRSRIFVEISHEISKFAGDDFLLSMKINGHDLIEGEQFLRMSQN